MRMRTGFIATLLAMGVIAAFAASAAEAAMYTYTGSEQTFAVPANVTGIHVVAVGARGAGKGIPVGGFGAMVTADLPLPPGASTLYAEVGGNGTEGANGSAGFGGWNGGGRGGSGGGGASDVRTASCATLCATGGSTASLNSRLAVACGGGGAGYGADGGNSGESGGCCLEGTGGTLTAGGTTLDAALVTELCQLAGDENGEPGSDGGLGYGGAGAYLFLTGTTPESGGGGGGWYGGGGGPQCYDSGASVTPPAGAGGGGSSAAPTSEDASVVNADTADPAEVIITAPVPTATGAPSLDGGLAVGDQLTESHGSWITSLPLTGYTYQWERCDSAGASCSPISGADEQTYTLTAADLGDTLRVQETASNFYGTSAASTSSPTAGVVGEAPTPTAAPGISSIGIPTQGEVLDETHASWTDGPLTGYSYQWERCDPAGADCTAILGAEGQTYALAAADVGSTIRVQETTTNAYGTSQPATSAPTAVVQAAVPPTMSITGPQTTVVGTPTTPTPSETITVSPTPPLGTIQASMIWTFARAGIDVTVVALSVVHAPVGAQIVVLCTGGGCPRGRTIPVRAPRCKAMHGKRCRTPSTRTVSLAPLFAHRRLARGAHLTIRIVRPRYVGKVYVFSMRAPGAPLVACLAPGSSVPAKGC